MNDYRNAAREVHRETRWTALKFAPLVIGIVVVLAGVGFGLRSLGIWGGTQVERAVFESSYQRSESLKAEIATNEATLTEINRKLANTNLDANTRANLEAQASATRIRIETAKRKQ